MSHYYSNGKLLITGEYTVLDGALALAVPTQFGQSLHITPISENNIIWKSIDHENCAWFEDSFPIKAMSSGFTNPRNAISNRLVQILKAAQQLHPYFLNLKTGFKVESKLDFPTDWGLGSSSTLINNIAQWANVDAYQLLKMTFGGSGYDIACAQHDSAITYQLKNSHPEINNVYFNPDFKEHLYFVYLNKKKNSREGIIEYNKHKKTISNEIKKINSITKNIVACSTIEVFDELIEAHETIISSIIKQPTVKNSLFKDFNGAIKSLGAWGGDFILVSSVEDPSNYFKLKGYHTIIPFNDMVLI